MTFDSSNFEIRKLTPPKIDSDHLGEKIMSHRPMRIGAPRIEIEQKNSKIIAHNYGHGGSGWTIGPGSVRYINKQFVQGNILSGLEKNTPITIVGAGIIGLFSAYDLIERGYSNLTIIAESLVNLPSHHSGGLIAPVSMKNNDKDKDLINQLGIDSYRFYELISKGKHPLFKKGARDINVYFENRQESGLEGWVGKVLKPAKDVILDFGNGTKRQMVAYDNSIFFDPNILMQNLHSFLKEHKVKFVERNVNSWHDIDAKYIINCTGAGSYELENDKNLVPVQGHLIALKDQNPKDLDYIILKYFPISKTKTGLPIKRAFYMMPKVFHGASNSDIGVIGGSFVENADNSMKHDDEYDFIIKNAKEFYGI